MFVNHDDGVPEWTLWTNDEVRVHRCVVDGVDRVASDLVDCLDCVDVVVDGVDIRLTMK